MFPEVDQSDLLVMAIMICGSYAHANSASPFVLVHHVKQIRTRVHPAADASKWALVATRAQYSSR